MSQHSVDSLMDDLRAAIAEVEALMESTASGAGEQAAEIKTKADRYVHDKPWQAIGIAAGLAFVVGLLVSRR